MSSQQSTLTNSNPSPVSGDNIRGDLEQAQTMLFHIKMLQNMAFSAGNEIDKNYKAVDYAGLLNEFIPRLHQSLENIERALYSNQ